MLLFYLLYAASNPIDRICNKEALYAANTTMISEQSKQYRLMNGKLLFSGDFHVGTNWQIMFAILCKNPNIAIILIITRKLFTSGRIRKSPLHNIEHTMPPLPLQKPTSLQLQVSKSYRSIFSNLSFTFNHLGRMKKICQILLRQMKSDFYLGSFINATSPVTVETSPNFNFT